MNIDDIDQRSGDLREGAPDHHRREVALPVRSALGSEDAGRHRQVTAASGRPTVVLLFDGSDVDLDLDEVGVDTVDGSSDCLLQHRGICLS